MKNNTKKSLGFSLVEVIISVAILTVLLTCIPLMVKSAMNNTKDAQTEQQAALYGQQIFENFKSSEVTKVISNTDLKLSSGINLTGDAASGYNTAGLVDLGNGYGADITVKVNPSKMGTAINKQVTKEEIKAGNKLEVSLSKDGESVKANDTDIEDQYDQSKGLTLLVYSRINEKDDGTKEKEVIIESGDGKELVTGYFNCDTDAEKEKAMYLIINLDKYKLLGDSSENIILKVYNEDEKDINIIAKGKSEKVSVSLEQYGSGKFKFYDENTSTDLYDITVSVKRNGKIVFNGSSSQNMNVSKEGDE